MTLVTFCDDNGDQDDYLLTALLVFLSPVQLNLNFSHDLDYRCSYRHLHPALPSLTDLNGSTQKR